MHVVAFQLPRYDFYLVLIHLTKHFLGELRACTILLTKRTPEINLMQIVITSQQ